jgi:site-specific recombinase XerD
MLRHTFATNLLRKNAKLPYIQKLLGHKNIATTQTYLTVLDNDLRETSELLRK